MKRWSVEEFEKGLEEILDAARQGGRRVVRVTAKELHYKVFGPPRGGDHRMPLACRAMWNFEKRMEVRVICSPPKGAGPRLEMEFTL